MVLRELFWPTVAGTLVVALLFAANEFIAVYRQLEVSNIPGQAIVQLVLLRMPYWLTYTLPTGVALGASLAVSRFVREGELNAMRSAGVSIRRALLMVWVGGLAISTASWFISERVVPRTTQQHLRLSADLMMLGQMPRFEQNVMLRLPPYVAAIGQVERERGEDLRLREVMLIDRPQPGQITLFMAPEATYRKGVWTIPNPAVYIVSGENLNWIRNAETVVINQRIDLQDLMGMARPELETARGLWERIQAARIAGQSTREIETTFYERFSIAASCLVFAVVSAFLAVRFSRASAFQGLVISFITIMLYYNVHIVATTIIGRNGWLPPVVAAWLPAAAFGLLGLWLSRGVE